MDPAVDHGDRELHHGVVAGARRHHLQRGALTPKDATMTTENARPSPSLALARRIAAVGLLAGVLAFLLATPPGASASTTERIPATLGPHSIYLRPSISADGRFVAFASNAPDLVP